MAAYLTQFQGLQIRRRPLAGLLLVIALGFLTPSCSTPEGGSKRFAAITLRGYAPETIRQTTAQVFLEEGYMDASRRNLWCYDRGTSKMGQLLHGGWFEDESVRERAKLRLIPLGGGAHRLECEAVMVRFAGDSFFEEETRMTRLKSGPYKKLLSEVERRLAEPSS